MKISYFIIGLGLFFQACANENAGIIENTAVDAIPIQVQPQNEELQKEVTMDYLKVLSSTIDNVPQIINAENENAQNTVIDFGKIPYGDEKKSKAEVLIKNMSAETFLITKVQPSCGCTTPDFTKTPINAGGTGRITIAYDPTLQGSFLKTVTVYTNLLGAQPVVLTIKGEVLKK